MTSQGKVEKAQAWLDRTDPRAKMLAGLSGADEDAAARTVRLAELTKQAVLSEYAENDIEPVYADPERTMLVSLAMMLHNGWRIEKVDGRSVLTREDGL